MKLRAILSILLVGIIAASCAKQMVTVDPEDTVRVFDAHSKLGKAVLQAYSSSEGMEKGRYRLDIFFYDMNRTS